MDILSDSITVVQVFAITYHIHTILLFSCVLSQLVIGLNLCRLFALKAMSGILSATATQHGVKSVQEVTAVQLHSRKQQSWFRVLDCNDSVVRLRAGLDNRLELFSKDQIACNGSFLWNDCSRVCICICCSE